MSQSRLKMMAPLLTARMLPRAAASWVRLMEAPNAVISSRRDSPRLRRIISASVAPVIAGEADQTVPIEGVRAAVKQICAAKQPVTFRSYPGLDHDPAMEKSTPDQLAWIRDRFAGKPAGSNCASGG